MCRFSAAGNDDLTTRSGDRRLKSAKARNRVGRWWAFGARRRVVPQTAMELVAGPDSRRSACANWLERRCNLDVLARMLLNGDFTFCPIRNFKGLNRQRRHARQLLRD
jgi:hypothetical protein